MEPKSKNSLKTITQKIIWWIGSPSSLVVHSIFFIIMLGFILLGYNVTNVLLVLTTIVSLEAIYLAIFIQYSVNQQAAKITEVVEDISEVTEDVGEISKDVEEISKDIDEIQEEAEKENESDVETYARIEQRIALLLEEVITLKKKTEAGSASGTAKPTKLNKFKKEIKAIGKKLSAKRKT